MFEHLCNKIIQIKTRSAINLVKTLPFNNHVSPSNDVKTGGILFYEK